MARASGLSYDQVTHATAWYLRDETLVAAIDEVINYHHGLPSSNRGHNLDLVDNYHQWEKRTEVASSDARKSSLCSSAATSLGCERSPCDEPGRLYWPTSSSEP